MVDTDLCYLSAVELERRIRRKELSPVEVMEAHLEQIERINPRVNAIVTLAADQALDGARKAEEMVMRGEPLGPLHGLPAAHKDLQETAGIRTTFGSPLFKDYIPAADNLFIQRMKQAGAVSLGKTNTPEWGAGSQTFNPVFGATRNPYDPSRTCGGSSGGAAVALAARLVPVADGSDMGGSLRNPASFCNVVGMRPSPGRCPTYPERIAWFPFTVSGPMGRSVADAALLMSAVAGYDPRSPIAIEGNGEEFARPLGRDFRGVKVALTKGLGLPYDPVVWAAFQQQRAVFEALGCIVDEVEPDFTDANEIFQGWRAWAFDVSFGEQMDKTPQAFKDTIRWNINAGRRLTAADLGRIEKKRTQLFYRVHEFMREYEFFLLPTVQVLPFDINTEYITQIDGVQMETYIDWMMSCCYISVIGHPAMSVPCAFSPDGLPIGLQIVGRHHDDLGVFQLGYAFEQATGAGQRIPDLAARPDQ